MTQTNEKQAIQAMETVSKIVPLLKAFDETKSKIRKKELAREMWVMFRDNIMPLPFSLRLYVCRLFKEPKWIIDEAFNKGAILVENNIDVIEENLDDDDEFLGIDFYEVVWNSFPIWYQRSDKWLKHMIETVERYKRFLKYLSPEAIQFLGRNGYDVCRGFVAKKKGE